LVVHFRIDANAVSSGDPDAQHPDVGNDAANGVARFSSHSRVGVDTAIEIAVDTDNLHLFEFETHNRIA
jgi:hypothetical protein